MTPCGTADSGQTPMEAISGAEVSLLGAEMMRSALGAATEEEDEEMTTAARERRSDSYWERVSRARRANQRRQHDAPAATSPSEVGVQIASSTPEAVEVKISVPEISRAADDAAVIVLEAQGEGDKERAFSPRIQQMYDEAGGREGSPDRQPEPEHEPEP